MTFPRPADPIAALTRPDGTTEPHSADHGRVINIWENVKHWGAVGNGTTDDSTIIQACIDFVGSQHGGTIYFPPGKYQLTTGLVIDTHCVKLRGAGRANALTDVGATILNFTGTGSALTLGNGTLTRMSGVEDMTISADSATSGVALELDNSYRACIRNVRLRATGAGGVGVLFTGSSGKSTYYNEFYDVHINAAGYCCKMGDVITANVFYGGVWDGTGIAVSDTPTTDGGGTNKWFGTAFATSNAIIVEVGDGVLSYSANDQFIGCRLEPSGAAGFNVNTGASRVSVIGGSVDVSVTFNAAVSAKCLFIVPSRGMFFWDYANPDDPKTTISLRSPTAHTGITFTADTNIYRESANVLATDDDLHVVGDITGDGTDGLELTAGGVVVPVNQGIRNAVGGDSAVLVSDGSSYAAAVGSPSTMTTGAVLHLDSNTTSKSAPHIRFENTYGGAPEFMVGTGSPEGVWTASPGSLYLNIAGGANTSLYVKESGSAATGWVAK